MLTSVRALGAIGRPLAGELVAREGFLIDGFAFDRASGPFVRVSVSLKGDVLASSSVRYRRRRDVAQTMPKVTDERCGFRMCVSLASVGPGRHTLSVTATFPNGSTWSRELTVLAAGADYRSGPYGTLVDPHMEIVHHRGDIYSVGPPSPLPSVECLEILSSLLDTGERVIDIGCGVGAYGPALLDLGVDWHGCEINPAFVMELRRRKLPVTQTRGAQLPFAEDEFETAMCIEVLEHVEDYAPFVQEVARVSRRRAIFSVPNAGAIPVLADRLMVPWHLLETDHKNFFTRSSLRATLSAAFTNVDVIPYGIMPVTSSNGTPVYYHLLAVAEGPLCP